MVIEGGLLVLGKRLGVTDPKEGWDATCKKLEAMVKAGRAANTSRLDFAFLEQLNVCTQAMKHAWRNKVNHAAGRLFRHFHSSPKFHIALNGSRRHYRCLADGGRQATDYATGAEALTPSSANTRCWSGVGTASLSKAGTAWLTG
jgi:hypothetical protein